jgi:hypothetical protein
MSLRTAYASPLPSSCCAASSSPAIASAATPAHVVIPAEAGIQVVVVAVRCVVHPSGARVLFRRVIPTAEGRRDLLLPLAHENPGSQTADPSPAYGGIEMTPRPRTPRAQSFASVNVRLTP